MARQKRKRGGQPGNSNAVKHGFYSRYVDREIRQSLPHLSPVDAQIARLRLKIKSIISNDKDNLKVLLRAVNTLSTKLRQRQKLRDMGLDEAMTHNEIAEALLGMLLLDEDDSAEKVNIK